MFIICVFSNMRIKMIMGLIHTKIVFESLHKSFAQLIEHPPRPQPQHPLPHQQTPSRHLQQQQEPKLSGWGGARPG